MRLERSAGVCNPSGYTPHAPSLAATSRAWASKAQKNTIVRLPAVNRVGHNLQAAARAGGGLAASLHNTEVGIKGQVYCKEGGPAGNLPPGLQPGSRAALVCRKAAILISYGQQPGQTEGRRQSEAHPA